MIELKEQPQKIKIDYNKIKVIVFNFNSNADLLGLTCNDWLKMATLQFNTQFVNRNLKVSEEEQILSLLSDSEITIVLHAFNPLITKENIAFYIDYLVYKNLDLVKLPFGYIFKTNYILKSKSFKEPILFNGINNEFLNVETKQNFNTAFNILKNRIIDSHILSGVKFIDVNSTVIHYFVEIKSGVTIYPFNLITGKTQIFENCLIKEGNTIEDSILCAECVVSKSVIKNSSIGKGTIVSPFNTIIKSKIEDNCLIKSYNQIEQTLISSETTVESFNNLGN